MDISIHAPREGGDGVGSHVKHSRMNISIHAPREGGDLTLLLLPKVLHLFQSTPPARGATAKMHSFICESLTNK